MNRAEAGRRSDGDLPDAMFHEIKRQIAEKLRS
jgi:hypothetical protein